MTMQRRTLLLALPALGLLPACGFQLRQAPNFAFKTLYAGFAPGSPLGLEFRRTVEANGDVTVLTDARQQAQAQALLDVLQEQREKSVVGLNAVGQVREFQIRLRVKFRLRTPQGRELIPETELLQQRDISFVESQALAKEAEENFLYRDMQKELVSQLMRRLAAVKAL